MNDPKKFEPKPLDREAVEVPIDPRWKVMGPEEEKRLRAQALADHRRFDPTGPHLRRRYFRYVVGTAVGFALLAWFFVSATIRTLEIFGVMGAVLGLAVARFRPLDFTAGGLYALAALSGSLILGVHLLLAMLFAMLASCIGIGIGRTEEMKRIDGE